MWKGLSHLELPHDRGVIIGILRAPAVQPEGVAEVGEVLEVLHVLQLRLVDLGKEKGESEGEGRDCSRAELGQNGAELLHLEEMQVKSSPLGSL